jgi:type IX secretion system PorP/SprF family membrane protein
MMLPVCTHAQADIHFSQFYETSMLRNPALTGVFEGNYKISGYYRNQWNSVTDPYETMLLDLEYQVSLGSRSNDFLSFGLLGYNDKAGALSEKISAIYPALNFNKCLNSTNNAYLSFGFIAGYLQYSYDQSKATFNNQFQGGSFNAGNPTLENLPNAKMTITDMGAGINFNMSPDDGDSKATYVVGVSGYHLSQPVFSYYKVPAYTQNMRWNLNAAMVHDITEVTMYQLQGNYARQGVYSELIFGGLIGWRQFQAFKEVSVFEIYAGLLYRYQDAYIPVIKMRYHDFSMGFSYDVNISKLKAGSHMQGGPEITLALSGHWPKNKAYSKTVCPRFN